MNTVDALNALIALPLVGLLIRTEARITRLETIIEYLKGATR